VRLPQQPPEAQIPLSNAAPGSGLEFCSAKRRHSAAKYQVETVLGGLGVSTSITMDGLTFYCVNGASLPSLQKADPRFLLTGLLSQTTGTRTFVDVTQKAWRAGPCYE